ncbi:MAG TPA: branched-chain amino acid transaminase [Candidatus Dormibacteraeota bacterium]
MSAEPDVRTEPVLANGPRPANTWVYFNGQVCRYEDVHLGLMTHALHYGTGCFEGIRAYWNEKREQLYLLQAAAHYERLKRSGKILRMEVPHDTETLIGITLDVLRRNQFRTDTYIRPLLFKSVEQIGVQLHGLPETFAIYMVPFGKYVETESGIRCMVSSWRRVSDESVPARAKITGAYINSALAKSEALESGYDEAIVLSSDGHVSEGSAENLFMIKDGKAFTPPVTDDILEGVTRQLVMNLLRDEIGMPVLERSIDRTELYTSDELLLCGTGAQISPVIEVDHRVVGDGRVGEITQELQQIYFGAVRGENQKFADWTIPVY